jgi:O-antigen ligase
LLIFAAQVGFSFEVGSKNGAFGGASASIVSPINSDQGHLLQLQTLGAYLLCCLVMLPFIRGLAHDFVRNRLITCFLCFALLSAFWSSNVTSTLMHATLLTISVAVAYYLVRRFAPNELMKLTLAVGASAALGSILLIGFFPQYGLQDRGGYITGQWQGIFEQKNICGFMLTLLLLPIFYVRISGRYSILARAFYSVILLLIIAETRSVGAWTVCLCCIGFSCELAILRRMRHKDRLTIVALSTLAAIGGLSLAIAHWGDLLSAVGRNPTLTGRTTIWSVLLLSIMKHPILGYGYMGFWQGLRGESANVGLAMNWPGISYAENGIIELCLGLGIVGVMIFLLIYAHAVRDAFYCLRRRASHEAMWYTTILVYVAASNIESGRLFFPSDLGCILFIAACVGLRRESDAIRNATPAQRLSDLPAAS